MFGDRITGGLNLLLPTRCSRCQPLQDYIRWKKINKLMALSLFGVHSWFPAVFSGIVPQRMKPIFPSRRDDGSLDLLAAFVSRREI